MRLCANVGAELHLVHPLGFTLDEPRLRRAGLDYRDLVRVREHANLEACLARLATASIFALSTRGQRSLYGARFEPGDALLVGPETRGLPPDVLERFAPEQILRIPLRPGNRSLNLSNAAAVAVYEAWRQCGFEGAS
jgi:tRNA (cytidine/uridine-2'-O-)-methyltransferase